jgi:hypothetical protein
MEKRKFGRNSRRVSRATATDMTRQDCVPCEAERPLRINRCSDCCASQHLTNVGLAVVQQVLGVLNTQDIPRSIGSATGSTQPREHK